MKINLAAVPKSVWLILLALFLVSQCTGCATNYRLSGAEIAYQSMHAVDVLQTMKAADDPCRVEGDQITRALIGEQPSQGQVLAWGVAWGVSHYFISRALERKGPRWAQIAWHSVSIGSKGVTINHNNEVGVRLFGDQQGGSELCRSIYGDTR